MCKTKERSIFVVFQLRSLNQSRIEYFELRRTLNNNRNENEIRTSIKNVLLLQSNKEEKKYVKMKFKQRINL